MQRVHPTQAHPLHHTAATRRLEHSAAATLPPHTLMQRAGLAVARGLGGARRGRGHPVAGVQRVLQNLLAEMVSIRDLPTIMEAVSESSRISQNIALITEHVRMRLARHISHQSTNEEGYISILAMSPAWEQSFIEALNGDGEDKMLTMAPSRIQDFITAIRQQYDELAMQGETPVLLTSPGIRPYVRSIVERFRPQTTVLSQNEIHPKAKIKTLGQI